MWRIERVRKHLSGAFFSFYDICSAVLTEHFTILGWYAAFQLENLIGVFADVVLGRGGEAHQRRVEIGEEITK